MDSDTFDAEIRQPLYDLQQRLTDVNTPVNEHLQMITGFVHEAVGLADDYRINLLDQEDEEEEREFSQPWHCKPRLRPDR